MTEYKHEDWLALLRERFGDDPMNWAFRCPRCGDVATGADMKAALAEHPRTERDGQKTMASFILGQECIGRTIGALQREKQKTWDADREKGLVRGCDWTANGLFRGPDVIKAEEDVTAYYFPIAEKEAANA